MAFACKIASWLLMGGWLTAAAAADLHVLVVQSDSKALYQDFTQTLVQNLSSNIRTTVLQRTEEFNAQPADLIVTVGVRAADWVAERTMQPQLAAMVPSSFQAKHTPRISAIYFDQPWRRQVSLLRAAMPELRKVGMLHSTGADLSVLKDELARYDLKLIAKATDGDAALFADLEEVLTGSEVLLALPDSAIYNGNTIRNILLTSYRRGIPMVGFSQGYVRAGALCAIFSTPGQLAAQAGDIVNAFVQTRKLPDAQFPALYTIEVNQEVARTLGLTIKSADALRLQIVKTSGGLR
jgi:putative ABC transport system substrate-binding protein